MKDIILSLVNSDSFLLVVAWGIREVLGLIKGKKPSWEVLIQKYKGHVIRAIKLAEAEIPDDTTNKGMRRLDCALQYAIRAIEVAENRPMTDKEKTVLNSAISEVHNDVK
jgi:hypothetical protein